MSAATASRTHIPNGHTSIVPTAQLPIARMDSIRRPLRGAAPPASTEEFDLVHLHGNLLFWGARHVDNRGFDSEQNRPTNLQIPPPAVNASEQEQR